MLFSKNAVTSFKSLTLTLSGMRCIDEYEIICNGEESDVAYYTRFYTKNEDERSLNKRTTHPTEAIIKLFNECRLLSWNGFRGRNPIGVRDGYMFVLKAEVNDGLMIRAEGSNNYPKHYRTLTNAISDILNGASE